MKILYYDCFAGISGDMNLGTLIDLGVPLAYINEELAKLKLSGYEITLTTALKNGISGSQVKVVLETPKHSHGHGHGHGHGHNHEHDENRTFSKIKELISASTLSDKVKQDSIGIFKLVAIAEGKIHNKPAEEVHFHEVGAIDSIVDIVGAAICIAYLQPDIIQSAPPELGSGFVNCAHGKFPVPAPATLEILKNIPFRKGGADKETTTPTGAAILAYFVNEFTEKTEFSIEKIGYGLGFHNLEIPNVLRTYLGTSAHKSGLIKTHSEILECNIDDMSPEYYDYLIKKMLKVGAQDVFLSSIIMKKSRPGTKISVLVSNDKKDKVIEVLLRETTTLGIRSYQVEKTMLKREFVQVETPYGSVQVKKAFWGDEEIKYKAEYEDCCKLAAEKDVPVASIIKAVDQAIRDQK